ncbi:MAG: SGNH/GDSL hydrolase family protein [Sedimentisphaerales bacterium]
MQKTTVSCMMVVLACSCCPGVLAVADVNTVGENMSILFIGDSISVGVGASVPANRYTTLVTNALNQRHKGYEYKELNFAVSGSTLVDQLWPEPNSSAHPYILEKAIRSRPDIVVIQHGTNDNGVGSSIGQFLWSYRQVVRTIKEKLPRTRIVCMTICPSWGIASSTNGWRTQANVGIQEIAALENTLLAHTNFKLKNRRELFPDSIHPNDEGQRIMAESIIEALDANEIRSKDRFDFICDGFGQYRICGYVFDIKAENSQDYDGWVCFYGVSKKGFTYVSDCNVDIASPWKFYNRDFIMKLTSEDANTPKAQSHSNNHTGQGTFSLSQTNGRKIKVIIE